MLPEPAYLGLLVAGGLLAGAIASVSGFGIGSVLTPLLGWRVGTKLAVAVVSVPHFVATSFRLAVMREHVDRKILLSFGLTSAAGGLTGALLHSWAQSFVLAVVFGCLLVFTGISGLTGLSRRLHFKGAFAWLAGALSGFLGGLVGNQGGIRSGAMLGFPIEREAFVATATAVGVLVDLARLPVYLATQGREIAALWPAVVASTVGCLAGTVAGSRLLRLIPEPIYRKIVSSLVLALGVVILGQAWFSR